MFTSAGACCCVSCVSSAVSHISHSPLPEPTALPSASAAAIPREVASFSLPPDLRPSSTKPRYLRTIQLIPEPMPAAAIQSNDLARCVNDDDDDLVERSRPHVCIRQAIQPKRTIRSLRKTLSAIDLPPTIDTASTSQSAITAESPVDPHTRRCTMQSNDPINDDRDDSFSIISAAASPLDMDAPSPIAASIHSSTRATTATSRSPSSRAVREQAQALSSDEVDDLPTRDHYFGAHAKTSFFSQYQSLYSKPYLFVHESAPTLPSASSRPSSAAATTSSPTLPTPTGAIATANDPDDQTESHSAPAYPSEADLKVVASALAPLGPHLMHCSLPTRDHLSPRSQFLSACVTRPHLAVPMLVRRAWTKVYDFSFQSLGDEFIVEFARCLVNELPYIEDINVRDNRLSDHGLDALLQAIAQGSTMLHLQRLDISQNCIGSQSAQTLKRYIQSAHCSLRHLLVDSADIDDSECASFMTAFARNLSIQHLSMRRNRVGQAENLNVVQPNFVTGGEAIASMLHINVVLTHLDLSWNFVRLQSSVTLAASIRENHTLTTLNLAYNACGDAGAMALGDALRSNQCLEHLDLSYNSIGCKGALVLANALRSNTTMRTLELNGNNLGREGGQQLIHAVCESGTETGCELGLRACNLNASVISAPAMPRPKRVRSATPSSSSSSARSSKSSSSSSRAKATKPKASKSTATTPADELDVNDLPVYSAPHTLVFNAKEPTGRYKLDIKEPYDKMIAMELLRLASFRKGCRFLRVEYRATASSSKSVINLVRPPRHMASIAGTAAATTTMIMPTAANLASDSPQSVDHDDAAEPSDDSPEDILETLGLDALFTEVDRDHSGSIDREELVRVLNRLGLFPCMEQLTSVLARIDGAHSDHIAQGMEFSAVLFHAVFGLLDRDASGKIDADEVEDAFRMLGIESYDEKEIVDAIALYDLSGDGEMEESEFVGFMRDRLLTKIKVDLLADGSESGESATKPHKDLMLLDASTQRPWVLPEQGLLEIDFVYEREAFASTDEAYRYSKLSQDAVEHLVCNLTARAASPIEKSELIHVALHDSEIKLTAAQAYQVLDACGFLKLVTSRIEGVALLLPQMLTPRDAQILVARTLTLHQRCRLKAAMGSAYAATMGNPTAHYSLDLAKPKDRAAAAQLAAIAQSEKLFSQRKARRSDTSQHGNWENFRNEELDGQRIVLTSAFFRLLPAQGRLSFDYISTKRPPRGTAPLSQRRFAQLIRELQTELKPDEVDAQEDYSLPYTGLERRQRERMTKEAVALKLVQIESVLCDRWLCCSQAAQILSCMPTEFHAQAETARLLFSRLIDVDQFYRLFDAMSRDDQRWCAKALGWLNIFNPMVPERAYLLDLSIWDEREMTKLLVELAIAEPGENWIHQRFSPVPGEPSIPGWKLPVRWEKEDKKDGGGVNRIGVLEIEYYSGEDRGCAPVPAFRKTLLSRVLAGTKQYCF